MAEDAFNYPTPVKRSKPVTDWKGKTIPAKDTTVQTASRALHDLVGSGMGESQDEYASVLDPQVASYQNPVQMDMSFKTPAHAEIHLSVQNLMPKVWFGLSPDDLAKPLHGTGAAELDKSKLRLVSHTEE